MPSVLDLARCAERHLSHYTDPGSRRAWRTYDDGGDLSTIAPLDLLAPALLDARVAGETVIAMWSPGNGPEQKLLSAIRALMADPACASARFEDLDLEDESGPWGRVREVLRRTEGVGGVLASKATKVLHRKRPDLVPIFDSKVAGFYGCTPRRPGKLWPELQVDVRESATQLDRWRSPYTRPDGLPLGRLRALDIVVWEHVVTRCTRG